MTHQTPIAIWEDLHTLTHLIRERMLSQLREMHAELGFLEMRVLIMVGEQPGIAQKELIERSVVDKAQMARTLTHMEDKQWLHRRTDDADRRIRRIELSAAGVDLYRNLQSWREQLAQQAFGLWSAQSLQDLQASLGALQAGHAAPPADH